jgi:hypothetical protein
VAFKQSAEQATSAAFAPTSIFQENTTNWLVWQNTLLDDCKDERQDAPGLAMNGAIKPLRPTVLFAIFVHTRVTPTRI